MWENKKPVRADQIRVNRGLYCHFGIYEDDNTIYQFASPKGSEISPDTACVCTCTLDEFLKGGILEVRTYSDDELKEKKSPDEIINYAKAHLGEMGYNLITNNCEHFANRCTFGKSISNQSDEILSIFGGLFR